MEEVLASVLPAAHPPVEHLLVGSDFTAPSDLAIARALECGNTLGAQVTVLHVVEDLLARKVAKRRQHRARELLARRVQSMRNGGMDVSINVRIGDPSLEIIREAIELASDAIVLGFKGGTPFRDGPAASMAAAIARFSDTPLLLVARQPAGPYRRCAVDVTAASHSTTAAASRFAPNAVAFFTLLHSRLATAPGGMPAQWFRESHDYPALASPDHLGGADRGPPEAIHLVDLIGEPLPALLNCASEVDADLLIVGAETALPCAWELETEIRSPCEAEPSGALPCDVLLVSR
jgi:nucleotide-binding universal stress UspA family protein